MQRSAFERSLSAGTRWLAVLACALVAGTSTYIGPTTQEPSASAEIRRTASLRVRVERSEGGALEDARIRIYEADGARTREVRSARSNKRGEANFEELKAGPYWVLADATGRARRSTAVALLDSAEARLTLPAGCDLRVDVAEEDGKPIAGADVEVLGRDPMPIGARTDGHGVASVENLDDGPFTVTARWAGFDSTTLQDVTKSSRPRVVLRKLGRIVAAVTTGDGASAKDARVAVVGSGLWPPREGSTNDQGTVEISGLAPGLYAVRAVRGSMLSPAADAEVKRGTETRVALALTEGVHLHVRVMQEDEPGRGIVGARVTFAEGGLSPFPAEAISDRDGRATLGPFLRTEGVVVADATDFVTRTVGRVEVPSKERVTLRLARAGRLRGRVLDARGLPIDGAILTVVGTDDTGMPMDLDPRRGDFQKTFFQRMLNGPLRFVPAGELGVVPGPVPPIPHGPTARDVGPTVRPSEPWVTRERGTFLLAPVSPGRVQVIAHHPEYVEAASSLVVLEPGGEQSVDVVLRRGGMLEGRVVDDRASGVAAAEVRVTDAHGSMERTTRTASDGSFAFAALPAEILLSVSPRGALYDAFRMDVHVQEEKTERITIRLPAPRGSVLVRIRDVRDFPVKMVQVVAVSEDATVPWRSTVFTNADGEATLTACLGLPLRVELSAPGYASLSTNMQNTPKEVRLVLVPGTRVEGEVRGEHGERLEGAEVSLHSRSGVRQTRSNKEGEFSLADVSEGDAQLVVRATGYARAERPLAVQKDPRGRAVTLGRMDLLREAILEGRVVDGDGRPVLGARVAKVGGAHSGLDDERDVVRTDKNGAFSLRGFPAGEIALEASDPQLGHGAITVQARAGDRTRDVEIRLERERAHP